MGIGVGDEKSRDDLPPLFIVQADDERLANPGEGFKGRLDFGGNDLFAARDDHVGGAPEDADRTVMIDESCVARLEPAVMNGCGASPVA